MSWSGNSNTASRGEFPAESYWAEVHATARRVAWQGYEKRRIPDFALRLRIVRIALHLADDVWTDKDFARALFGGDPQRAAERFNKFKRGHTNVDETEASLLASLVNYFLDDPVHPVNGRPTPEELLDIPNWILQGFQNDPNRITALDIGGDLFAFTRKLIGLVEREAALGGEQSDERTKASVHDLLMQALVTPLDFANWDRRLIVQHPRPSFEGERTRFGAEQSPGTDPRTWLPAYLDPGKPIEYGLALRPAQPMQGWLVTVRDPWPVMHGVRAGSGTWLWQAGWENVIRWTPSPFPLEAGQEVAAPVSGRNILLDMTGLFHVFLLTEPRGSRAVAGAIAEDDPAALPDEAAYFRLLAGLTDLRASGAVSVYAGSYVVE